MIITQAVWDRVIVTYDESIERFISRGRRQKVDEEELRNVRLFFEWITEDAATLRLDWGKDRSMLLTRARLVELTPWSIKFEAYWCRFDTSTRADVVCEF
jgi:hypothetical protein